MTGTLRRTWARRASSIGASWLILTAALLLAFPSVLAGHAFTGGELNGCFEPLAVALRDALRGPGGIARTQLLFNGLPLLAHPVSAAAYPPQWLVAVLPPAIALTLLSLAHLLLSALGVLALLRRRVGAWPALAGAVFVLLAGVSVSSLLQPNLVRALGWMPWVAFLTERVIERHQSRRPAWGHAVLLAVATAALLLTAEPFVVAPTLAWTALIALSRAIRPADRRRQAAAILVRGAMPLAAGLLLALPLLWPAMRYLPESVRSEGFVADAAAQWSLHPAQLLSIIVPRPFGDPTLFGLEGFMARALVPGRGNEYFASSYAGALALGLALGGALSGRRARRPALAGCAVLLLLALGSHGPAAPLLGLVDTLRYPVKWLLPAVVPMALLVGEGAATLRWRRPGPARRTLGAVLACCALAAAVSAGAGPLGRELASLAPDFGQLLRDAIADAATARLLTGGALSALPALAVVAVLLLLKGRARARIAVPLVALVLLVDLGKEARRTVVMVPRADTSRVPGAVSVALALEGLGRLHVDQSSGASRLPSPPPRDLADLTAWHRESLWLSTPASYGIPLAFPVDIEALSPARIHHLSVMLPELSWRERLMLLGAAGATHVAVMGDAPPGLEDLVVATARTRGGPLRFLRNPFALARVRMVAGQRQYTDAREFRTLLESGPDDLLAHQVLIGEADWATFGEGQFSMLPPSTTQTVVVEEDTSTLLRCRTLGDGGYLVVADAWLPGMSARVDGAHEPLVPANHAFSCLRVDPGEHVVEIRYDPWGVRR